VLDERWWHSLLLIALGSVAVTLESACGGGHAAPPLTPALEEASRQALSFASQGGPFYPFYSIEASHGRCVFTFGNDIAGKTESDFGKDTQYGSSNVAYYFGQFNAGPTSNPCA
jgi:hypothetical protein